MFPFFVEPFVRHCDRNQITFSNIFSIMWPVFWWSPSWRPNISQRSPWGYIQSQRTWWNQSD